MAICARFSEKFSAGWREDGRKMGEVRAKLAASWDQLGHDSAKLAILGSTWEVLEACWEHFGTILDMGWIAENLQKQHENNGFQYFGVPGGGR